MEYCGLLRSKSLCHSITLRRSLSVAEALPSHKFHSMHNAIVRRSHVVDRSVSAVDKSKRAAEFVGSGIMSGD